VATVYPGGVWRPLGNPAAPVTPDIICVHTMVGNLTSTDAYFRDPAVTVYSHFGVGGAWGGDVAAGLDGVVWQWQDTDLRAAANLDGNWRVISIETADNINRPIAAWTPKQITALAGLIGWLCDRYQIPKMLIPDTLPGRRGVGWHAQGVPGVGLVPGGEQWSTSTGKDCPTAVRINQLRDAVMPRVADDDLPFTPDELRTIAIGAVEATFRLPE
jgi:hypothetical protein